ncbi:heterokaryon incompatibility protein-domain-containing protein [Aspergillus granulosus]|uniref:Heterokaryon incompatibility protein-domain-containing protein n=1 Tax=Aspergillus granulosus TaxID=176169 RepID=A0ABR4HDY8_9EURO
MLQQARAWLSECADYHGLCEGGTHDWLPTRLIYVGDDETSPRLCLPGEVPMSSHYVALSHCWGAGPSLKLRRSNLDTLRVTLPMSEIPKSFMDALMITRGLGYKFLWIDSLCIIQDNEYDWAEECSRMRLVYENAVCTISALDSRNSRGGCFGDRDPRYLQPPTVQTYWTNRANGLFWCANPQHLWGRAVSESALYRRGWVLQEQVLSRRILHFSKHMVFWECRSKRASEVEPDGLQTLQSPTPSISQMVASSKDGYDLWRTLVIKYSKAQLTYGRDKLVAISGIARMIHGILAQTGSSPVSYHAGLWSPNLASQLLWDIPAEARPPPTQPKRYRAPTWSWASIDGEVSLPTAWEDRWVVVQSVVPKVVPLGRDPFQQVQSASLEITGYLWKARNVPPISRGARNMHVYYGWDNGSQVFDPIFAPGTSLYLLPIRGAKPLPLADADAMYELASGLMVVPCDNTIGAFRRIGIIRVYGRAEVRRLVSEQRTVDGNCSRCMRSTGCLSGVIRLFSARGRTNDANCPRCSDDYTVFTNLADYFWSNKTYFAPLESGEARALRLSPKRTIFDDNRLLHWTYRITLV